MKKNLIISLLFLIIKLISIHLTIQILLEFVTFLQLQLLFLILLVTIIKVNCVSISPLSLRHIIFDTIPEILELGHLLYLLQILFLVILFECLLLLGSRLSILLSDLSVLSVYVLLDMLRQKERVLALGQSCCPFHSVYLQSLFISLHHYSNNQCAPSIII